jgi:uncharacterized membrane protein
VDIRNSRTTQATGNKVDIRNSRTTQTAGNKVDIRNSRTTQAAGNKVDIGNSRTTQTAGNKICRREMQEYRHNFIAVKLKKLNVNYIYIYGKILLNFSTKLRSLKF